MIPNCIITNVCVRLNKRNEEKNERVNIKARSGRVKVSYVSLSVRCPDSVQLYMLRIAIIKIKQRAKETSHTRIQSDS